MSLCRILDKYGGSSDCQCSPLARPYELTTSKGMSQTQHYEEPKSTLHPNAHLLKEVQSALYPGAQTFSQQIVLETL